ncbi:MAG: 4-(cytidine 5'-diphospho)-2-C-methyl-D-erythritol kinase [Verrucomicrobiota bacterium]
MPDGPTAKVAMLYKNSSCSSSVLPDKLQAMQVLAPAKINLSLRVLKKRGDGFHEIETLISPISLFDELEIEKQSRWIDFQCDDPSIPQGDDNLVVRAAKLFFESTGQTSGVSIRLKKRIPHGAGLGGGSSDAASTLMALNDLFATQLPRETLARMAGEIGSDIPFFIFQSAAICRGRGELVAPAKLPAPMSILLLKPEFSVPTEWAYQRWQDSREIPGINYGAQGFENQTFTNDLERPVFEKFVFLGRIKMWLLSQPEVGAALMSGSGSTIFAVMKEKAGIDTVAKRAKSELDPQLSTFACGTLGGSSSPLLDAKNGGEAAFV